MKKSTIKRVPIFLRIKEKNKTFIERESKTATVQDTVDKLIAGYRKLKRTNSKLAAKYF